MVKRLALVAALFVFAGLTPVQSPATPVTIAQAASVAQASLPPLFDTENAAQAHCPKDVVVWLNIPSGIYHYKGERWYGLTKHGAYACEKEAIKAGDRASENGQ
jgi:hypothetical protein